jgi:hypothetical protein
MYNKVWFHNRFHAGDIFESREFVKKIMEIIPANLYLYSHPNSPRILLDVPNLEQTKEFRNAMAVQKLVNIVDDILYISTWMGNGKHGNTLHNNFDMFKETLRRLNLELPGEPLDYIPKVDYKQFNIANIDDLIKKDGRDKIFISNGIVLSKQADNFDMTPAILKVAAKFPGKLFFVTSPLPIYYDNIIFTSDLIGEPSGCDLNELSYLSTFCSIIVGRNSGPQTFANVRENWYNPHKKLITFFYEEDVQNFVMVDMPMKKVWSGTSNIDEVVRILEKEIEDDNSRRISYIRWD